MYLKRLEMIGFKSFADKIKLQFMPGVTAVVGPNGSGKSNISDAIRWVLGEQSVKSLRGSKMDDVIFAGTQTRKPLGLAEVTLVLDNSKKTIPVDFAEIAITRRLFRSGESEYLLNKAPVRLRDIQELFYDTGLGKEAYSVIGQGKIDSILSAKADERRSIFEEAAGIIKYKSRKQVAQHKLADTDQNLLRVQDILRELESQIEPLKQQAVIAERYLTFKEELTNLEINYFEQLLSDYQLEVANLNDNKNELEERLQDFGGQESIIEAEIEQNRLALLNQDNLINAANEEYFRIQNQIDKYQEQLNYLKSRAGTLEQQEQEARNSQVNNSQRRMELLRESAELEEKSVAVTERILLNQTELEELEAKLAAETENLTALEEEIELAKKAMIAALNEAASLRNNLSNANLKQEFITKQIASETVKENELVSQLTGIQQAALLRKTVQTDTKEELEKLKELQVEFLQQRGQFEQSLKIAEEKTLEFKEKIRGLESKIGLLEEMERSYQGYFQGVKALMAEASNESFTKGIRGIVADLIKVKSGMELALETALGSSLQNVVIETGHDAEVAISYLKQYGKGRATFLPLNLIRASEGKSAQLQATLAEFGCQPAIALLEFDESYRPMLNYLLNTTIIAPNLKAAVQLSTKLERGYRIVTPEGDLVNPGGSMTGGSIDKRRLGLLTRRREIEDLRSEKQTAQTGLIAAANQVSKLKEDLQQLLIQLETVKSQENEVKIKLAALEREFSAEVVQQQKVSYELELLRKELSNLQTESEKFAENKDELLKLCTDKELLQQELETKLATLTTEFKEIKEVRETTLAQVAQLRSDLNVGGEAQSNTETLRERLRKQISEIELFWEELEQKCLQIINEQQKISVTRQEVEAELTREHERICLQEAAVNGVKQQKEQFLHVLKELESKERGFRRKLNELQNQIHKCELAISKKTMEIESINKNLVDDYGETWVEKVNQAYQLPEQPVKRIDTLKMQIRELGTVNLAAIEDYQQVTERYQFLTTQSEDLLKAKASLEQVIVEIEKTITERFNETFQLVRTQFQKIYTELFEGGGGMADLMLLEPDSPLTSGIEIIAQPPGKKLQSLSLLSGGERAMTAVALLFAILSVKPSPFCVLDEIDAALDETNVHRFAKLLGLFSDQLQFIVVTHRRGTMEAATAIYGVTMEEHGVSKLISLDLSEKAV